MNLYSLPFCTRMIWRKRWMAEWMLCTKWMIIWFTPYTKPSFYQNGCSPKIFSSNHPWWYGGRWLVRHSSMSPNQQRRPLPSLLYLSFLCNHWATTDPTCGPWVEVWVDVDSEEHFLPGILSRLHQVLLHYHHCATHTGVTEYKPDRK